MAIGKRIKPGNINVRGSEHGTIVEFMLRNEIESEIGTRMKHVLERIHLFSSSIQKISSKTQKHVLVDVISAQCS